MDKFDKKISDKLESIQSETHAKDWERFNKKFTRNQPSVLKIAYKNLYKIAATLAITSMLFIASAQYFKISDLKKQLEESKIEKKKLEVEKQNYLTKIAEIEEGKAPIHTDNLELLENKNIPQNIETTQKKGIINVSKPAKSTAKKKTKKKFFTKIKTAISSIFSSKKDSTNSVKKPLKKQPK